MNKLGRSVVWFSLIFLLIKTTVPGQEVPENQYRLQVVDSYQLYEQLVAADSSRALVNLESFIPGIALEVKYATAGNFMEKQLYPVAKVYLRKPAAAALKAVQQELESLNLGLKVFGGYRPYRVTVAMWEPYQDPRYVANPANGSRHNRGCAVDVTLVSLGPGNEIPMPTGYDDFTEKAHHDYANLSEEVLKNRYILKSVMEKYGFQPITSEWWHYDYRGWEKYHVMDIPLSDLP